MILYIAEKVVRMKLNIDDVLYYFNFLIKHFNYKINVIVYVNYLYFLK